MPECACGLTFLGPWDLVAHLLSAYPPGADKPPDGEHHADATRLAVKLDTGSSRAWEIVTWAWHRRKGLRVAAAITFKAKAGDLQSYREIPRKEIRDTYSVSMHVASAAVSLLQEFGIVVSCGGRNNIAGDIEQSLIRHSTGTMLDQVARHVASLEDRMSMIEGRLSVRRAEDRREELSRERYEQQEPAHATGKGPKVG